MPGRRLSGAAPALSECALHLAIDLGAGGGRAMVGGIRNSQLLLSEVHRFQYPARVAAGHLRWNFQALIDGVRSGIRCAASSAPSLGGRLESLGVDSWGVDYGLLDADWRLLEDPVAYRDVRTAGVMDDVFARLPREEIFKSTGIQFLPINTLYQLVAHMRDGWPARAARLLMIADLCHHALCGSVVTERTNASTTQLMNVTTGHWDSRLFERLGLPLSVMPEIVAAGASLGKLSAQTQAELGVGPLEVLAPATHDTASALAGTPLTPGWAYISSGTWSLVGVELAKPLVCDASARENFTNEGGAFGSVRFLKNVMGLWILDSCFREWKIAGVHGRRSLFDQIAEVNGTVGLVFPDDQRFFNPPSMTGELRAFLSETGQAQLDDPALLTKVILDSLALRYTSVIRTMEKLTARPVSGIHVVGGGSMNDYLNQATADASGLPVVAGPVEATAAGNILVQAIARGELSSLSEARELLSGSVGLRRFEPRSSDAWREAAKRYEELAS